jgi:hypothetical protein
MLGLSLTSYLALISAHKWLAGYRGPVVAAVCLVFNILRSAAETNLLRMTGMRL